MVSFFLKDFRRVFMGCFVGTFFGVFMGFPFKVSSYGGWLGCSKGFVRVSLAVFSNGKMIIL